MMSGDRVLPLFRVRPYMGRGKDILQLEELVCPGRLLFEYIHARAKDLTRFQRIVEVALVDDAAPRAVDEDDARLSSGRSRSLVTMFLVSGVRGV